ncbi:DUF1598 domain-containing protein [Planctomicrobium sp. SH664]|uniref:DUF1598 domain-containing protein n=1 Tax=Planctomicrobium sp. SH664 TaxID=3448125 RepID=UPI003F5BED38
MNSNSFAWRQRFSQYRPLLSRLVCGAALAAASVAQAQDVEVPAQAPAMDQIASLLPNRAARVNGARDQVLNGGSGANFGPLMQLIQRETEGPWFDEDGSGGTMSPFASGISVDPRGVLARDAVSDNTGRLSNLASNARVALLNEEMSRASELRLVSLTRLEKEIARRVEAGQPVVESMRQLAGLSQIQYVFVYPEEGEIVIGGPAEGWKYNGQGVAIGATSGQPTLQLDDLVTVLRTFGPGGMGILGCSIDPRPENIKAVKEFAAASQQKGDLTPAGVRNWATQIGKLLGAQDVTVFGVPSTSRVARVMVDADYKMKLIGVGKLEGGSNIPDYFELVAKQPATASSKLDALRWWLTMQYEAVMHSPDQNAYQIRGSAVLCKSENQFLTDKGERVNTGTAEPVNEQFAANFTKHYAELAAKDPVFAELQGIFDLALVAALIQRDGLDQKANWDRGVFDLNGGYETQFYPAPKETQSVVNHKVFNGKDVVLQVAGGVRADLAAVVNDRQLQQESPRLSTVAKSAEVRSDLPAGRWWWDAK